MSGVSIESKPGVLHRLSAGFSNVFGRSVNDTVSTNAISMVEQIGETAGRVWQVLDAEGPTELRQLVKEIQSPEELVVLAVGWLAREEKINIDCRSHGHLISLR